jgi:hypothetical protein
VTVRHGDILLLRVSLSPLLRFYLIAHCSGRVNILTNLPMMWS